MSLLGHSAAAAVQARRLRRVVHRNHTVQDGLEYVANWNSGQLLLSQDLAESIAAAAQKRRPAFAKL